MQQLPLWLTAGLLPVLAVAPVYLVYRVYGTFLRRGEQQRRQAQQMSELHMATIEALALAIDAKDQTARNHIGRVQVYATALAHALRLSDADVHAIRTAALLHDIGKLAVPEHILAKPGPLTAEELQKLRIHPQVGAAIIANVPFPHPVAPLVLGHHERWDGRGYPAGLQGEAIPLGARILGLVDCFDALTSHRPSHRPAAVDAAMTLIKEDSGKAFDPRLVEAFAGLLPEIRAEAERAALELPRFSRREQSHETEATLGTVAPAEATPSVFDDIALAHGEIYALYQISQTMGTSLGVLDTMALISSKLTNLVPFSACALFLYVEGTETAHCRFATGTDSELIQQLVLKDGQGLTGWVARNRRPLVNARPSADLEAAGSNLQTTLQSALVCPLIFGEHFIGTLAVYHTVPSFYRDDHRRLLHRVCEQAAAVIHNAVLFEQTQEASLTDPLTGLPNTRFMLMHLPRELARADRLKSEVSLLVMDLDEFKDINDTYGHYVGDQALREVAQALRATIRPYDVCMRYAGDEFIVILPGCGRDEADHKRLDLQRAVERIVFEAMPGTRVPLWISAGAAVFPQDGVTYEALLAAADSRMYLDKGQRKRSVRVG
jgi:diguanylate cyclase (GGDEF)-like protein/putative nucleotidyltransferase with HDIG domain